MWSLGSYICTWGTTKGHCSTRDPTQQILDMPNNGLDKYSYIVWLKNNNIYIILLVNILNQ